MASLPLVIMLIFCRPERRYLASWHNNPEFMFTYFLLWFPLLLLAVLNGALRDLVYKKYLGEQAAHQLSTVLLLLLFTLYIGVVLQRFPPRSPAQALFIGGLWLALTLAFEFGFGRWRGASWAKLLADYNILQGRLWVLIPLWVALAPWVFYKWGK